MAAADIKGKKRKGAPDSAPTAKKPKNTEETVSAATKPAKAPKSAPAPTEKKPAKGKTARKEAADFFSDNETPAASEPAKPVKSTKGKKKEQVAEVEEAPVVEVTKEKTKKAKKSKQAESAPVEDVEMAEAPEETAVKKTKKSKASKKQEEPKETVVETTAEADDVDEPVEEDDQTAALLAGFESDEDEKDPDDDEDFEENAAVPALSKKQKAALEKAAKGPKANEPGVVYVGRVPRGFFEPQMKQYFSQFGRVKQLRLSRNKKTGASKHYAFVEFQSGEVADIVARTMDNYLLFGHILKCKLIPAEQVKPDLFKGAGLRFKVDPRNKKAGLEMERGVERAQWEKRVEKENSRRSSRNKQLKEDFGYEYNAPQVKAVNDVPKQLENGEAQPLIADAPAAEEPTAKKGKKAVKSKATAVAEVEPEVVEPSADKKPKNKKRKSDVAVETPAVAEEVPAADSTPKGKKAKKDTKSPAAAEEAKPKKARKAKA